MWKTITFNDGDFYHITSAEGDKVRVNLPLAIIKLCIDAGMELPNINGKNSLKSIDFNQVFMLINAGVIGKLVEVESADGDTVSITVDIGSYIFKKDIDEDRYLLILQVQQFQTMITFI